MQSRFNRNGAQIVGQHHIDLLVNVDGALAAKGWGGGGGGGGGEVGVKQQEQAERVEKLFEGSARKMYKQVQAH